MSLRVLVFLLAVSPTIASENVRRTSDDAGSDLIDALIVAGRFDDALQLTQSDVFFADDAKAAIAASRVAVARQMTQGDFDAAAIELASRPVADLLAKHSDHPRGLFLQSQLESVRRSSVRHAVLVAVVSPRTPAELEVLSQRLVTATSAAMDLAKRVADQRITIDAARNDGGLVSDLQRLEQECLIEAVSMSLLQTELFRPDETADRIAAAAAAIETARETLTRLPAGSTAAVEIERLRIDALLTARQIGPAADAFDALIKRLSRPPSDALMALDIRIAMASGQTSRARERLDGVYVPSASPKSVELDLTRLRFLLAEQPSLVAGWIDQIARSHGAYARQRAEAISLATMNASGSARAVDASLVAAQGRDRLRQGDVRRAAELLTAAARAQGQPDRAIEHAIEAAAAWRADQNAAAAADVLRQTALDHSQADRAAAVHLQSLLMSPADPDLVSHLEQHLNVWTDNETTDAATDWLVKIRLAGDDPVGAAVAMTRTLKPNAAQRIGRSAELWLSAFSQALPDQTADLSASFIKASTPLADHASLHSFRRDTATLVCDSDTLGQLPAKVLDAASESADATFLAGVLAMRVDRNFRSGGPTPSSLSPAKTEALRRRLMIDGSRDREQRSAIARYLQTWSAPESADQTAARQIWMGDATGAIATLEADVRQNSSAGPMKRAADLLASSDDGVAVAASIGFYDRLAAGLPQGTPEWHEAKLASIKLLRRTGRVADADKRAKYILLTGVDLNDSLRKRYEQFIQP